jgi:hypothetical protein
MTANVTIPPSSDGGFSSGLPGDRVTRGTIARWSANTGWVDRDGLPIPTTMLVIGHTTVLRRWKDKRPEYITEHPLPNPDELNAAIPIEEWENGLDGKPRPPWALTYVIYLVDLKTAALFTYAHDTFGAMQAYNALEERIAVMRILRGEHVFPIVHLEKRPWKSATNGMQMRPHLEPTGDWRSPGGFQSVAQPSTPQISGPAAVTPPVSTPAAPAAPTSTPTTPTAPPPAAAASAQPSSPILDHMQPVKLVTVGELIADEIPWK